MSLFLFLPVGIVNVHLLIQALTHSLGRAGQSEISVRKLEGAVSVCLTDRFLCAGVIEVCEFQLTRDGNKLSRLEVQQCHGAQWRMGEEMEEPDQVQTHLGGDHTCQNLISGTDDF